MNLYPKCIEKYSMGNKFKIQKKNTKPQAKLSFPYYTVKSNENNVSKMRKMNSYRVLFSESYIVFGESSLKHISLLLYLKF